MTLGEKIKMLRAKFGFTQKDLADKIHVTFQTISKWENNENEPDIATLKELAKLFECSIDYLLSPDAEEAQKETEEVTAVAPAPVPQETKVVHETVVIHQKEQHVCEVCHKDIPEDDLQMEQVLVKHGHRGRSAVYRQAYYHKACLAKKHTQEEENRKAQRAYHESSAKKKCFGWGIACGVVALAITIAVLIAVVKLNVGLSILFGVLAGYGIFSMLYCIISGSYIGDVFLWCASLSIKFPGIIFSWDLDGLAFLIVMKILFAILGFLIGVAALFFAIGLSALLGGLSFPFILVHNIHTDYEDAF